MLPKIYAATDDAAMKAPPIPLDGTLRAAQRYVDRITRSAWWRNNCPPNFHGEIATKVVLKYDDAEDMGAALVVDNEVEYYHRGKSVPLIYVGPHPSNGEVPAIADPWLLLHELAHVWEFNSGHGKEFIYAYCKLVRRYMGIEHLTALVDSMRNHRMKLNYSMIEPSGRVSRR